MTTLTLNGGVDIPMLGFGTGTSLLRSKMNAASSHNADISAHIDRDIVETIKSAVRVGYRHLDTAEIYQTEPELGMAIQELISEGLVQREDLFITTKISSDFVRAASKIDVSLKKLGLDYVDLYLVHTPYHKGADSDLQAAWAAMEEVKASGKARSIGVSNFEASHLEVILQDTRKQKSPSINQVEFHPYLQQQPLRTYSRDCVDGRGIALAAYGAMHPITRNPYPGSRLDRTLELIAAKHGVSIGLVCLRWCIEQGVVVVTVTQKEERMREYLGVFNFKLDGEEVKEIAEAGLRSQPEEKEYVSRVVQYHQHVEAESKATATAKAA